MNVAQVLIILKDCLCSPTDWNSCSHFVYLNTNMVNTCANVWMEWVWIEFVYTKPTQTSFWAVDQTVRNFNWNQLANW